MKITNSLRQSLLVLSRTGKSGNRAAAARDREVYDLLIGEHDFEVLARGGKDRAWERTEEELPELDLSQCVRMAELLRVAENFLDVNEVLWEISDLLEELEQRIERDENDY